MTNRDSLLGRSRPTDRLSKKDRQALESTAVEPAPKSPPATPPPAENNAPPANAGKDGNVRKNQLKFHWTTQCPACGFKLGGSGDPQPGQRLGRCGRCKLNIFLTGS